MNQFLPILLKYYQDKEFSKQLKARFVLVFTSIFLVTISAITVYSTLVANSFYFVIFPLSVLILVVVSSLILLIRGKYLLSIHIILGTSFIVTWFILFFEPVSALNKTNSIVYIIALLSAIPFLFSEQRKHMLLYFAFNIIFFLGYCYYLDSSGTLIESELVDYFSDNLIAIVFVFAVAYNLLSINQSLLKSKEADIIEINRTAKELHNIQILLNGIINAMPSALIAIDQDYKVTHWNKEAEKCAGVPQKESEGSHLFAVFPELAVYREILETVIKNRVIIKKERQRIKSTEDGIINDIVIYPLGNNGSGGAVLRIDDISERLKMENVMLQSARMITLGGLAAGMAHEINNPLAGMLQNSQLIQNRLTHTNKVNIQNAAEVGIELGTLNKYLKQRDIPLLLQKIRQSGSRIAKLVDDMLTFSTTTDSPLIYRKIPDIIEHSIELSKNDQELMIHKFDDIHIKSEYAEDLPDFKCNGSKLNQVFMNLLKNSTFAIFNRKYLKKEKPHINIIAKKEADTIQIEFEDNGCGMPQDMVEHIFEPFYSTMPVGKGQGLGLYIAYFIITKHLNGLIEVVTKQNVGTKFIINLPIN
jgi:PAS domain S-box-containing protein